MTKRIIWIDQMRLVGAVMVIMFHLGVVLWGDDMFPTQLPHLVRAWQQHGNVYLLLVVGDQAVPLFILISGLVLELATGQQTYSVIRRLRRLLLPYWWAVVIGSLWLAWLWRWDSAFVSQFVDRPVQWHDVVWGLLALQNWSRDSFRVLLPAWWFIPLIVQLALIYPVLHYVKHRLSGKQFLLAVVVFQLIWNLAVVLGLFVWPEIWFFYHSGLSYLGVMGIGMWLADRVSAADFVPDWRWLGSGLLMIAWGWWWIVGFAGWLFWGRMLTGIGWFCVLAWLLWRLNQVPGVWLDRWSHWGRQYSYQIYLWHQLFLWTGWLVWQHVLSGWAN